MASCAASRPFCIWPLRRKHSAKPDEYRAQAQITELNALNASLAVIRFKQHFLMLDRVDDATCYIFDSAEIGIDRHGSAT